MTLQKKAGIAFGLIICVLAVIGLYTTSTYNRLIQADQEVQAQWAQVENAYQRRLDLVPNLVETVKGAANFEKSAYLAVAEARTKAANLSQPAVKTADDPARFANFQQAQDGLTTALSRLMVVVERYPNLKATENFRDLQAQLEGSENRITVERMRFNEAAGRFNTLRDSFPANLVAGRFGARFQEKSFFQAQANAETAPQVRF